MSKFSPVIQYHATKMYENAEVKISQIRGDWACPPAKHPSLPNG
jgi:hypothetical protein